MFSARQAFQQGTKGVQALCVQTAERLAGAVPAGQFKRAGTAFAASLQQLEFGTQLLRGGLADEAEPAMQQGIGFLRAGILAQLQINVPQQLPGEGIQCLGLEALQPAALAKRIQPGARAAIAEAGDQQLKGLLGTCRQVFVAEQQVRVGRR